MPNWIEIHDNGIVNLDSGMVVQLVHERDDKHHTRIWSLHNGDRYLMGDAKTFDHIQALIQRNITIDYYSEINDIHWTHRVSNCFHAHGIDRVSDLLNKTEADLL